MASALSRGDLQGRIAVVTGAGSGLGRSIAIGLARAGAIVAIADIDTKAAEETLAAIKRQLPDASAVVITCNVTDEQSVRAAYDAILAEFGGLDILVNAAGVAPAYPLVDLPVEKWRVALEVNLTGYLLMAKHAAKIMLQQDMGGSIINISSKSGLDASMNNTPYNATKAGELHMARGWAMELGPYGIRVNSVCPGNVFEGSKIWNPQYIKTCARKYGIKPEDVIPYYINKTAPQTRNKRPGRRRFRSLPLLRQSPNHHRPNSRPRQRTGYGQIAPPLSKNIHKGLDATPYAKEESVGCPQSTNSITSRPPCLILLRGYSMMVLYGIQGTFSTGPLSPVSGGKVITAKVIAVLRCVPPHSQHLLHVGVFSIFGNQSNAVQ
jgi:NAD(P)-dependent dehydrogenase (short-subunit alcohol dehydrogenase family)